MNAKTVNPPIARIPFQVISKRIARHWDPFERNPHIGLLAPTGCGKSFLIRHGLLPIAKGARVVVIDVKPGGDNKAWGGWGNDVESLTPGFGTGPNGTPNYRVMVKQGDNGHNQVRKILDIISAEGECILVMDDSKKITAIGSPNMGLHRNVDSLLSEGRSAGTTIILAANSNTWATSGLKDQCAVYFTGNMTNTEQRDKFANIIGLPRINREIISTLPSRTFLYCDNWNGISKFAITSLNAIKET